MDPDRYQRINAILDQVIDLEPAAQEQAITQLCNELCNELGKNDQSIESDVRRMLQADRDFQRTQSDQPSKPFMATQAIDSARNEIDELLNDPHLNQPSSADHKLPETIAGYTIIREIGRGGMGVVYECQQENPKRRVAIKLVESILRADALNKRLAAESHIQGQLQHPAIARVYDAGVTVTGHTKCPYFVMELIQGEPLHIYSHQHNLDHRAKVQLMSKVCEGMKHAHERNIIHRDLKPDNILVQSEGQPYGQPKILDFGIARFIDDSTLIATTMHNMTGDGQVLGTLAYMAPEQLSGKADQTDTRSDVFSLGAILYELLAGHPPFQLEGMSLSTAFRTVELDDPISIRSIDTSIDKDLETIVMRCLSKEPERRFTNAGQLNDELIRYLTNQPIRSRPPTATYRTKKFITRNKALVAGLSTTMMALIIGLVMTMYFASGQRDARILAQRQEQNARSKELDAIRGVLEGTIALTEQGDIWKGVDLLYTIAPESRGWEWEYLASSLPWIQDQQALFRSNQAGNQAFYPIGFIAPRTVLEYNKQSNLFQSNNLLNEIRTPVIMSKVESGSTVRRITVQNGLVYIELDDGMIFPHDPITGLHLPPLSQRLNVNKQYLKQISPDHQLAAIQSGDLLSIYQSAELVFEIKTGFPDNGQMQWNTPIIDQANHSIYLLSWNNNGEIIAIDTNTWTIRARKSLNASGPTAVLSPDGSILYANTDTQGIIKLNPADLSQMGFIDESSGMVDAIMMTPDGSKLIATLYDHNQIRVYDRVSEKTLQSIESGTSSQSSLLISPDSEILLGNTPADFWNWIIPLDPDKQLDFTAPNISHLDGHNSWVYQLAISPDGSLLASAEPQGGDVLLWNLHADQLIARFTRPHSNDLLFFYMNGPLVFDETGTKLTYAQHNSNTDLGINTLGLTTIDLQTGTRSWTPTESQDQTIDAAADIIGQGTIHHHASALPDGRILQASASVGFPNPIRVRGRVESTTKPVELKGNATGLTAGVAVHPDGGVYASGEYLMTRIYDTHTDELLHEFTDGIESTIYGMTYSPDGSRLAMGLENGSVLIFDTVFYKLIAKINVPSSDPEAQNQRNYIFNLIWTPDSQRLITAGGSVLRILESERRNLRKPKPLSAPAPAQDLIRQIQTWSSVSETDN